MNGKFVEPSRAARASDSAAENQNSPPVTYFNNLSDSYLSAAASAGGQVEYFLSVAGYTIKLCFAGPALVRHITRALEHLASDSVTRTDLTVCLWDSASTSVKMLPPEWGPGDIAARGEIKGYNTARIHTAYHLGADTLNMLDADRNLALFWTRDAGRIPYYEKGAPLRTILNWWACGHRLQLVHAAAVGTTDGGVLIAGRGGSGKSTIALTCINSGLIYAGDDYVVIENGPRPHAFSLYSTGKADTEHLKDKLPAMFSCVSNAGEAETEKGLIFLNEHYPDRIAKGFPIKAILLPHIAGRETRLQKASPAEVLTALAPSTLFQLAGADHEVFRRLSELVRQVPGYIMEIGAELNRIPEMVSGLISRKQ